MLSRRSDSPPTTARRDSGLGLIEILISIVILSIVLLGIAGTAARVGAGLNSTHERTRALTIAQNHLENLLAAPYDEVVTGTADVEGVSLAWSVDEGTMAKQIKLAVSYRTPGQDKQLLLTGARLRP